MTILDSNFDSKNEEKFQIKYLIVPMVLFVGLIFQFTEILNYDIRVIVSFMVVLGLIFSTIFFPKFGVKATFVALLLSCLFIFKFLPFDFFFELPILLYDFTCIPLLLIHYYINKSIVKPFLKKSLLRISDERNPKSFFEITNGFTNKFSGKSDLELEEIIEKKALIPEAIKAAEFIVFERSGGITNLKEFLEK